MAPGGVGAAEAHWPPPMQTWPVGQHVPSPQSTVVPDGQRVATPPSAQPCALQAVPVGQQPEAQATGFCAGQLAPPSDASLQPSAVSQVEPDGQQRCVSPSSKCQSPTTP